MFMGILFLSWGSTYICFPPLLHSQISAIVARRNLMIVRLSEPEQPTNLQFQERYGNLVRTIWFGNGNVLLGFDLGFIVCLSVCLSNEIEENLTIIFKKRLNVRVKQFLRSFSPFKSIRPVWLQLP
jgi:hypothetical protein